MNNTNPIFAQAPELPVNEREALVELLLDSLPLADQNGPVEVSDEWQAEIERRIASIQAGTATLVDGREVIAKMRAAIAETAVDELELVLDRRIEEIRTGQAKLVDMETAMSRIRASTSIP